MDLQLSKGTKEFEKLHRSVLPDVIRPRTSRSRPVRCRYHNQLSRNPRQLLTERDILFHVLNDVDANHDIDRLCHAVRNRHDVDIRRSKAFI